MTSYFDQVAPEWERMRQGFFPESLRGKAADAMGVRRDGRYLDVGAGSGFIAGEVLARGGRVAAVDASPAMVDELRARFPQVDARTGDAESLGDPDATYDGVFANMCLHHVERPAVAIREMARVLRPGGRVVITDLETHDFAFLREEQHDRWMGFEPAALATWLREAGLRDVHVGRVGEECCATSDCGTETAKVKILLATGRR